MSQLIIPNEWVIHDLKGENGEDIQKETFTFLRKMNTRCDKLVILEGGLFACKFYKLLMKDTRPQIRTISKYLYLNFLLNSEKCVKLSLVHELPENLKNKIPTKDRYLYQIRQTIQQGMIITTDERLQDFPNTHLRNKFLREYNSN